MKTTTMVMKTILLATRKAAFDFGYRAARAAGLDTDTSDAVAHAFVTRTFDEQLVGPAINAVLIEEIQKHANP